MLLQLVGKVSNFNVFHSSPSTAISTAARWVHATRGIHSALLRIHAPLRIHASLLRVHAALWVHSSTHRHSHAHAHAAHSHSHAHGSVRYGKVNATSAPALIEQFDRNSDGRTRHSVDDLADVGLALADQVISAESILVPDLNPQDHVASAHELESVSPSRVPSAFLADSGLFSITSVVDDQIGILHKSKPIPSDRGSQCRE